MEPLDRPVLLEQRERFVEARHDRRLAAAAPVDDRVGREQLLVKKLLHDRQNRVRIFTAAGVSRAMARGFEPAIVARNIAKVEVGDAEPRDRILGFADDRVAQIRAARTRRIGAVGDRGAAFDQFVEGNRAAVVLEEGRGAAIVVDDPARSDRPVPKCETARKVSTLCFGHVRAEFSGLRPGDLHASLVAENGRSGGPPAERRLLGDRPSGGHPVARRPISSSRRSRAARR